MGVLGDATLLYCSWLHGVQRARKRGIDARSTIRDRPAAHPAISAR